MSIDCDIIFNNLDLDDNNLAFNYQNAIILQDLKNIFGHMYIGGQKTLITDNFFIVTNIRVNDQMDASEFEVLLYKILSEKSFNGEIIHISNDDK